MNLQNKIVALGLLLASVSGALTIGISRHSFEKTLIDQLTQAAAAETRELSEAVAPQIETGNENLLLSRLHESQKVADGAAAMALDPSGRVVAHTDITLKGTSYGEPILKELRDAEGIVIRRVNGDTPMLRLGAPVWRDGVVDPVERFLASGNKSAGAHELAGFVVVEIPLNKTLATSRKIVGELALIILGIGAFILLLAIVMVRGLMGQVRVLTKGTERIALGDYGTRIPVSRSDELGRLADAFNRMSQALAETTVSKKFLDEIFTSMTEPLFVLDAGDRVRMCNQATLRLLGLSREEVVGHTLAEIARPRTDGGASAVLPALGVEVHNIEMALIRKGGGLVDVLYSCAPMVDSEGRTQGTIAVARDMTERKTMESAVRRSEKMSAVGQLAAGVAHEINNPLGVILGYAQALARRVTSGDPIEAAVRAIEKEAVRCKNLVQDLLTFSRVSKTEHEPTDLNRNVMAALSLVSAQARVGQITVKEELAPDLPALQGNPNQIQQIIINLATNAMDAMGGTGTLTVRTELRTEGSLSWACLRIIDTGSGIPPEIASRIFEPFFTTKGVGKGTGLGLSIVHEIVKKHSGTIDLHSVPGRTEFCVRFPVRPAIEARSA